MPLPENFQFSQGSLQDYVDCPRRFQLKYIQKLNWPAVDVEPALENEIHLKMGATFHRMVQQYFLGVPGEKLLILAKQDDQLLQWWRNFMQEVEKLVNLKTGKSYPEFSLSIPLGKYRLVGKFDLLSISNQNFTIFDWKTSRTQPKREWLASNLQTRVYPYILTKVGNQFLDEKPIPPQHVEMIYWFSNFPTKTLRFPYSQVQKAEDETYITGLIEEISGMSEEPAPLTENEKRCLYCVYRSLCNRGVKADHFEGLEELPSEDLLEFDLDFEQIAEIEF